VGKSADPLDLPPDRRRPSTDVLWVLLTDAIMELDAVKGRLQRILEMLVDARNRQLGLDVRSNEERQGRTQREG
jgi:hypothetical protein